MTLDFLGTTDYLVKQIKVEDLDSGELYTVVVNLKIGETIIDGFLATLVTRDITKVYNSRKVKWVQKELPLISIRVRSTDSETFFDLPWLMLASAVIRTYVENEPQPRSRQKTRYERSPVI